MEKSLKLINKTIKLSEINFNSFSSSKNWIGFFEIENKSWSRGVNTAISLFDEYFKKYKDDVFIISALNFDDTADIKDNLIAKMKPLHDKFKELGILQKPNECFEFSSTNDILLPAVCLRIDILDFNDIKDLAKLVMSYTYLIRQWCFIVFSNLNLVLYPHDEKGFGCIGLNNEIKNGVKFLEFCKNNSCSKVTMNNKKLDIQSKLVLPQNMQDDFSTKQDINNIKKGIFYTNEYFTEFISTKGSAKDLQIAKLKNFLKEGLICLDIGTFFIKNLKKEKIATKEHIANKKISCSNLSDFEWWTNHIEIKNINLFKDDFVKECFLFMCLVKEKIKKIQCNNVLLYLYFDLDDDKYLNADFRFYTLRKDEKIIDFSKCLLDNKDLIYEII